MEVNQSSSNTTYQVRNKDVELLGNYFDVVPDGNLYTLDESPIFAIRMRPMGIKRIMEMYEKKYKFKTKVLTYKINSYQYTLYSSDANQMYSTQGETILKYFDFNACKNNSFNGVIIVVVNENDRMIHAIPYIYGIQDGRKKVIFLDAFFYPDIGSGCIIGADFFYRNYNGDIDCYCHGTNVQADHHSCGIIACDFIKNCLKNKGELAKKIMNSVISRTEVMNYELGTTSIVNIFELPMELKKFSQLNRDKIYSQSIEESKDEEEKKRKHSWFLSHMKTLIYRRDTNPYDPEGFVISKAEGVVKEINTSLIEKGHKYAGLLAKELKEKTDYNSKYWLSLIKEQKNRKGLFKRLLKIAKHLTKKSNNSN